jgi:hypothetical protein
MEADLPPVPEILRAEVVHVACPGCKIEMVYPINPRTHLQDRTLVQCTTSGCRQQGRQWAAPTITVQLVKERSP